VCSARSDIGKTFEAQALADYELSLSRSVRWCRLAEFAETTEQLKRQLAAISRGASESTAISRDALDEVMVPLRRCWTTAGQWLAVGTSKPTRARLRITCRPAVWQPALATAMSALSPDERRT
jgi:hypothetical protein